MVESAEKNIVGDYFVENSIMRINRREKHTVTHTRCQPFG